MAGFPSHMTGGVANKSNRGQNSFIYRSGYSTCRYNHDSRDNNLRDKRILAITNLEN